ncbi:cell division topological specificity factor MinE [Acuticoccus mangrovi]|uniref:Cell division topological specificity factor n=1 Tax=Acuticoccus mangrovi TaxID=2796142 RepID=A0A934MN12_9HYPH|nr:cell division topological specificity factor MinE [Acuticoccus mangrovi]MBJ3777764.1 cell division topological specificity factor MinE [Acuticoccus mangrovi]
MNVFDLFRKKTTAPVARERLQIILAHERAQIGSSDLIVTLREEILAVIAKHMPVERDKVNVSMDRNNEVSMLEVEVELPLRDEKGEPMKIAANA